MPRITLSRVLSIIPLAWVSLVFLWLFLPSPSIPYFRYNDYIQTALASGQRVITVHENTPSFTSGRATGSKCSSIAIPWQLEPDVATDMVFLVVGETRLSLTDIVSSGEKELREDSGKSGFITLPMQVRVPGGDTNHIINLPWFNWADQILFWHQMHNVVTVIKLRAVVVEPGQVQIWKDIWNADTWDQEAVSLKDMIRITDREVGLLATFSDVPTKGFAGASIRSNIHEIKVTDVKGKLPSRTYNIRSIILVPLAPVLSITLTIFRYLILDPVTYIASPIPLFFIIILYLLCIAVFWLLDGRPPFKAWCRSSPLSRWLFRCLAKRKSKRDIWGASGPVEDDSIGAFARKTRISLKSALPVYKPGRSD